MATYTIDYTYMEDYDPWFDTYDNIISNHISLDSKEDVDKWIDYLKHEYQEKLTQLIVTTREEII